MKIPEIDPEKIMKMSLGEFVAFMKVSKFDVKLTIDTKDCLINAVIINKNKPENLI